MMKVWLSLPKAPEWVFRARVGQISDAVGIQRNRESTLFKHRGDVHTWEGMPVTGTQKDS